MEREFTTHTPDETISLGKYFAENLQIGDIVCLEGPLGAGKTHFVKGMAEAFGLDGTEVQSPTFTLINEYISDPPLFHFDCYRMESVEEALEIGAEEYFYDEGVCVIEWPELISSLLPPEAIWITIEASDKKTRKFVIGKRRS